MNCKSLRVIPFFLSLLLLTQNVSFANEIGGIGEISSRHADLFEEFNRSSLTRRVSHLEHILFGHMENGDLRARIERLDNALNSSAELKKSREGSIYRHVLGLSVRLGSANEVKTYPNFLIETKIQPATVFCYARYFQACDSKLIAELEKIAIPDNQNSETPKLELSLVLERSGNIRDLRTVSSDPEIAPATIDAITAAVKRVAPFEQLPEFQKGPLPVAITILPELRNVGFHLADHHLCKIVPTQSNQIVSGKPIECVGELRSKQTPISMDYSSVFNTISKEMARQLKGNRRFDLKSLKEPTISFRLLKNGQICNCRISRSSGVAALDAASIETIEKCNKIVKLPVSAPAYIELDATLLGRPLNGNTVMVSLDDSLTPVTTSLYATSLTAGFLKHDYRVSFAAADYKRAQAELETAYFIDPDSTDDSLSDFYQWRVLQGDLNIADTLRLLYKAALLGPDWHAPKNSVFPRDWARPRRSIAEVMRSRGANPESFADRVRYADECLVAHDTDGAIVQYKEALELKQDSQVHKKLGQVFETRDMVVEALDSYTKAYEIEKTTDLLYPLAKLSFKVGGTKSGYKFLLQAYEENPRHTGLHRILALHGLNFTADANSPIQLAKYLESLSPQLLQMIGKDSHVPTLRESAVVNFSIDAAGKIGKSVTLETSSGVSAYDDKLLVSIGTSKLALPPLKAAGVKDLNVSYRFPELSIVDRNGAPRFDILLERHMPH